MMFEKEAYARLGLSDPDYFAQCSVLSEFDTSRDHRQEGKTTRMLVNAALWLQKDVTVSILGRASGHSEDLRLKAAEYVIRLDFYPRGKLLGKGLGLCNLGRYRSIFVANTPIGGVITFKDHSRLPGLIDPSDLRFSPSRS